MGKKVKKRATRNANAHKEKEKEKRVSITSPKAVSREYNQSSVFRNGGSVVQKVRKVCVHLEKDVDLGSVYSKIESAVSTGCEHCREGVSDRKAGKVKGKHGKKKGASDKATWICLQCGHFSCGGVGLPTGPQSHAVRHARQSRHHLVIQVENPLLRWCFSCSTLLPVDKLEETVEHKDFLDIVKLLKKQSSKVPSLDVEDIWFGSGSVVSEVKAESKAVNVVNGKDYYAVRGLVNLGNTCFFNSVMQNLLAMDILREYLLTFEGSMGPLTSALKNFFAESSSESDMRNVLNPKSVFGCVCMKAPQFRGYQQQDSHELLRCLLDGLSFEDLCAKNKSVISSPENGISVSSFVDAIFGGEISSTISCVECGHSSVVYEPFLDLSLSVPMKKPLSKKAQSGLRARKTRMPPKRGGRIRPKLNKNENLGPASSNCNTSTSTKSSSGLNGLKGDLGPAPSSCITSTSIESPSGLYGESFSCAPSTGFVETSNVVHSNALVTQGSNSLEPDDASTQMLQNAAQDADGMSWLAYLGTMSQNDGAQESDSFCWMDYLEPVDFADDLNSVEDNYSVVQDRGSHDGNYCTVSIRDIAKSSVEASLSQASATEGDNRGAVSVTDAVKSSVELNMVPGHVILKSESTVDDDQGEECPVQVQDNEILLLPYKEDGPVEVQDNEILFLPYKEDGPMDAEEMKVDPEIFSSAVVDGEDNLGFDGLGDLFNEPEEAGVNHIPVSERFGNGFLAGNNTESDPDEVDDTDSPVSVESCLAHFIKPELLSGEHAWHCENCSKLLKEYRQRMKHRQSAALVQRNMSSDVGRSSEILQAISHPLSDCSASAVHDNGSSDTDENLKKLDARQIKRLCPNLQHEEESRHIPESAHLNASGPSVCSRSSDEMYLDHESSESHGLSGNHVIVERLSGPSEEHELGEDSKDVDLKCVKVMRDATKRILISKTPPILTIHLKRFGQDARGRLSKLNGHVGFKEYIDLGPYMDCRLTEEDNCIYRLVGVVEHSGSMRGGHYVAYVRGGDRLRGRSEEENRRGHSVWYYASDSHVCETTLEEVLSCEAYILFYEKAKLW